MLLGNNFEDLICANFEFLLFLIALRPITNKMFYCFIIVTESV